MGPGSRPRQARVIGDCRPPWRLVPLHSPQQREFYQRAADRDNTSHSTGLSPRVGPPPHGSPS
jgi:hypothetical protein